MFTDDEENGMADYIRTNYTHVGHLFQDHNLVNVTNQAFAFKYMDLECPKKANFSGHFIYNFKCRNGYRSRKMNLKSKRMSTKEQIRSFKTHIKATNTHSHGSDEIVTNADETYFQIFLNNIASWADKGSDEINIQTNGNVRAHATIMATICEDGTYIPLFCIAKGTTELCERNQFGNLTHPHQSTHLETSWMRTEIFIEYLNFLRVHIPNKRIHLLVDRHSTNCCEESRNATRDLNIVLHFVPSGATNIAPPLDVGVFGLLKNSVRKEVRDLMFACPDEKIEMKKRFLY